MLLLKMQNRGAMFSSPPPHRLHGVIAPTGRVPAACGQELRGFHAVPRGVVEATAAEEGWSVTPQGLAGQTPGVPAARDGELLKEEGVRSGESDPESLSLGTGLSLTPDGWSTPTMAMMMICVGDKAASSRHTSTLRAGPEVPSPGHVTGKHAEIGDA